MHGLCMKVHVVLRCLLAVRNVGCAWSVRVLYSSQHQEGHRLYTREGFLIPACGTRTPEYFAARHCADVRSTA